MSRILIFGNSGSGKSTLAAQLAAEAGLAHLDLDGLAWMPGATPTRRALADSARDIESFRTQNETWVIEGCYADLLTLAAPHATELIYLDLPVARCLAHARQRPWEPHKYASREAQDANLEMLLEWIRTYPTRDDPCSAHAHELLFRSFEGPKRRIDAPRP